MTIQPVEVKRDELGFWTHPAWPLGHDEGIPYSWFDERGLESPRLVEFEYDASEGLINDWIEGGTPNCSAWEPTKPEGDGWFVFSIHDTEDGPLCAWVRRKQGGSDRD